NYMDFILSKFKNNINQLGNLYNLITKYLGVIAFPLFFGLVSTSYLFIPLLFGEEWLASNNFFIIIALASIPSFLINNLASSVLYTLNKPNLVFSIELIVNGIYIILLLITSRLSNNIYLILGIYVIYLIFKPVVLQYHTNKYLKLSFDKYILSLKFSFVSSIIMVIMVNITKFT